MRPPKTDCIFEISIKKYIDQEKTIKIDTRNKRTNTKISYTRKSLDQGKKKSRKIKT